MLLAASYVFYGFWDWRFLSLIMVSTLTDFLCAIKIDQQENKADRKRFLMISVGVNLSVLFFFKYFNFFLENFIAFFSMVGINFESPTWKIILPVGISFYTFQTLSYTIDVYRKQVPATRNFLDYALYVSFFPQLVAGPIERAKNLLPQILSPRTICHEDISEGLFLIYWGLFKKIFIADNLGVILTFIGSPVSADGSAGDGGLILMSVYAFMFQLYCDFSAYSDIARGTAKLMGFHIMVNFRSPFFAANIQETWNRWHISLTTWIRDYLYFPLALMRIKKKHINDKLLIIIIFLIMGLWHGAAWNYILWGGYHGLLLAGYAALASKMKRHRHSRPMPVAAVLRFLSVILTLHASAFGLIFFQGNSIQQIGAWIYHLFANFAVTSAATEMFARIIFYVSPLLLVDLLLYKNDDIKRFFRYPGVARYGFFYITLYLMVVFGEKSVSFIYFQF
ncbi:MBOAT family O-acyltransferase [Desulfonema magnum]|nr:MBOAT family protein [Desulfonema magnum]